MSVALSGALIHEGVWQLRKSGIFAVGYQAKFLGQALFEHLKLESRDTLKKLYAGFKQAALGKQVWRLPPHCPELPRQASCKPDTKVDDLLPNIQSHQDVG